MQSNKNTKKLETFGPVNATVGSLEGLEFLESFASKAYYVVSVVRSQRASAGTLTQRYPSLGRLGRPRWNQGDSERNKEVFQCQFLPSIHQSYCKFGLMQVLYSRALINVYGSLELQPSPITTHQVILHQCRSLTTSIPTKSKPSWRPPFTGMSTLN